MSKRSKQIDNIEANLSRLTELLESGEIERLKKDSVELKKTKELLSHVRFKIKDTRVIENQQTGRVSVVVTYELPRIELVLDEDGNPNKDEFFYSTNMLDMISLEDMSKFQDQLRLAKSRIKIK